MRRPRFVVGDVGQEVDVAAQPGESDRDVERAAAHMLGDAPVLDIARCSTLSINASPITNPRAMTHPLARRRTLTL